MADTRKPWRKLLVAAVFAAAGATAAIAGDPAPPAPAPEATTEFAIVATTLAQTLDLAGAAPTISVAVDPNFRLQLHVDRVVSGPSPFAAGSEKLGLLIHSPTLTYVGDDPLHKPYLYRFRVHRQGDATTYELLAVEPAAATRSATRPPT